MYWWAGAARLVKDRKILRSGLITTNSITQTFNRRIVEAALGDQAEASIVFAISDHPWVDSAEGAAVRISMTVLSGDIRAGVVQDVVGEFDGLDGERAVELRRSTGPINSRLTVGVDITKSGLLESNCRLSGTGLILGNRGFVLNESEKLDLDPESSTGMIHPIRNGEDLLNKCRNYFVIDPYGMDERELLERAPKIWQHLRDRVYPEREQNRDPKLRANWWLHRRSNEQIRTALSGLGRYIATVETAKHRVFMFLDHAIRPEHVIIAIGIDDALILGALQSRIHLSWALATGGTLENRPRYNKTKCFETFPIFEIGPPFDARIRSIAEQIDIHRKRQQALHPELTLTGVYNVLEKLRRGEPLNDKERRLHEQGLVSVLRELHDELDRAVFAAYGWSDLAERLVGRPGATTPWPEKPAEQAEAEEELLTCLVALNAERAEEEARGLIRWLRPDYQNPGHTAASPTAQTDLAIPDQPEAADDTPEATPAAASKQAWPKTVPEQARAIADLLAQSRRALNLDAIASHYTARGRWRDRLPQLLDTLVALGRARQEPAGWRGV